MHECRYCEEEFGNAGGLSSHEKYCYLNPQNIDHCKTCGKVLKDTNRTYCSHTCSHTDRTHTEETKKKISETLKKQKASTRKGSYLECKNCEKSYYKKPSLVESSSFCSKSCNVEWRNRNRNKKLELEDKENEKDSDYNIFENHKKGEIGELKVAADLLERGYEALEPVSQNCPYDLVAHNLKTGEFSTVQVKYAELKDRKIETSFRRKSLGGKKDTRKVNTQFDVGAVYCPQLEQCYYVPVNNFGQGLTLRVESERNMSSIRWAENFEDFPD